MRRILWNYVDYLQKQGKRPSPVANRLVWPLALLTPCGPAPPLLLHREDHLATLLEKRSRSSASPSSSRSGDDTDGTKRRRREVTLANALKIPKDDIRRRYPGLFRDAFNSCDKAVFHKMLLTHCLTGCSASYKYVGTANPFSNSDHTEVIGLEAVSTFWEAVFVAIPDSLFDIVETKFRLLPNKQTSIVCKFLYSGTKVYKLATDDVNSLVYSQPDDLMPDLQGNKGHVVVAPVDKSNPGKVTAGSQRPFDHGAYLAQPKKVAVIGTLTFYTDAENKIFRFEFIFSVKN